MFEEIAGPEFVGVIGGGAAKGGHYAFVTIRLGTEDVTMMIEKSRVGVLMLGIATAAGMARAQRIANDPGELNGDGRDAAYALTVSSVAVGRSAADGIAVLDLHIDANLGREMNLYLAADDRALRAIRDACIKALALLLAEPDDPPKTN